MKRDPLPVQLSSLFDFFFLGPYFFLFFSFFLKFFSNPFNSLFLRFGGTWRGDEIDETLGRFETRLGLFRVGQIRELGMDGFLVFPNLSRRDQWKFLDDKDKKERKKEKRAEFVCMDDMICLCFASLRLSNFRISRYYLLLDVIARFVKPPEIKQNDSTKAYHDYRLD